ncbi:MAG: MFS transporter [Oscillospiraceae bacterium]|nr:MFS transporter [Oscillospiraceae bacterium]
MQVNTNNLRKRWLYLIVGIMAMLVGGIVYAWSVVKVPLASEFGWSISQLSLNYTLVMCCFCIGTIVGGILIKRFKLSLIIIISGILAGSGFIITSMQTGKLWLLYLAYAVCSGTGIGCFYIVLLTTVNSWFPEKRGFSSGCLQMGYGVSTMVFGTILDSLFNNENVGWRKAYALFGILIVVVLVLAGLIIKKPGPNDVLPEIKGSNEKQKEVFTSRDYEVGEMVRSGKFWLIFMYLTFVGSVGGCIISFAKDLVMSVGAAATLATTLVGIMSVFNGLGRVTVGIAYDIFGRKKTTIALTSFIFLVPIIMLISIFTHSLVCCIIGLVIIGYWHGSLSPTTSIYVSTLFGVKNFGVNYGIVGSNLMCSSLIATVAGVILNETNSYVYPFLMLIVFSGVAFIINLMINKGCDR